MPKANFDDQADIVAKSPDFAQMNTAGMETAFDTWKTSEDQKRMPGERITAEPILDAELHFLVKFIKHGAQEDRLNKMMEKKKIPEEKWQSNIQKVHQYMDDLEKWEDQQQFDIVAKTPDFSQMNTAGMESAFDQWKTSDGKLIAPGNIEGRDSLAVSPGFDKLETSGMEYTFDPEFMSSDGDVARPSGIMSDKELNSRASALAITPLAWDIASTPLSADDIHKLLESENTRDL